LFFRKKLYVWLTLCTSVILSRKKEKMEEKNVNFSPLKKRKKIERLSVEPQSSCEALKATRRFVGQTLSSG